MTRNGCTTLSLYLTFFFFYSRREKPTAVKSENTEILVVKHQLFHRKVLFRAKLPSKERSVSSEYS